MKIKMKIEKPSTKIQNSNFLFESVAAATAAAVVLAKKKKKNFRSDFCDRSYLFAVIIMIMICNR